MEQQSREEGALSAGLLAERLVLALGRALRDDPDDPLTDDDKLAFEKARRLFDTMASREVLVFGPQASRMLNEGSYFDALQVVELEADGGDVEDLAGRYAQVLAKLVDGIDRTPDEQNDVQSLRNLFIAVGETTLARSNEASRRRQDLTWRPTNQPSLHF